MKIPILNLERDAPQPPLRETTRHRQVVSLVGVSASTVYFFLGFNNDTKDTKNHQKPDEALKEYIKLIWREYRARKLEKIA
jgi:hypothetical protein